MEAFFTSNLVNHIIKTQTDDVLHFTFFTLRDTDNAIASFQLSTTFSRATFDQLGDFGVFIFRCQLRADTLQ